VMLRPDPPPCALGSFESTHSDGSKNRIVAA
jgi:hypothetical protein